MSKIKAVEGFVSFKEKVYMNLREAIFSCALKPGESLVERELSQRLGVSRTPVREALHKLEEEGLITRDSWKGSIVAIPTADDAEEVLFLRMILELLAIDLGKENITSETIKTMRELFKPFESVSAESVNEKMYRRYLEADYRFHEFLVDLCKKPRIIKEYKQWQDLMNWCRLLASSHVTRMVVSLKEHRRIIDVLEDKDFTNAQKRIKEHITNAIEHYREGLSKADGRTVQS